MRESDLRVGYFRRRRPAPLRRHEAGESVRSHDGDESGRTEALLSSTRRQHSSHGGFYMEKLLSSAKVFERYILASNFSPTPQKIKSVFYRIQTEVQS